MSTSKAKSISFKIFKLRLSAEIRNYWYCRTSFEYTNRWWNENDRLNNNSLTTSYPNDDKQPFTSIMISPSNYLGMKEEVLWSVRCNTITNIVTAFETYLYYQTKRAIYIDPTIIDRSGIEFTAGEIAKSFEHIDQKYWLAEEVVSKYIRNNSHNKMIKKIDTLIRAGISNGEKDLIERWLKKVTLRNALIHNAKLINTELTQVWSDKFSKIGDPIQLDDGDIIRCQYVAYELAKKIDTQFQRIITGIEDAKLLARVIYLLNTNYSLGEVAEMVYKILDYPFTKDHAESAIAYQKRTRTRIPDFTMIKELISSHLNTV